MQFGPRHHNLTGRLTIHPIALWRCRMSAPLARIPPYGSPPNVRWPSGRPR